GGGQAQTSAAPRGASPQAAARADLQRGEDAVMRFWDDRPDGVLAVRVGYLDEGEDIGDTPCIAASVSPSRWATFEAAGPHDYLGVPIRYLPADLDEQVQSLPEFESVDSIAYDDDARTGEKFSFAGVNEPMEMILHVGPEFSWDILHQFIAAAPAHGKLVSAMYEFHAPHIKDAIEERLDKGSSMTLVLDNATFSKIKNKKEEFDRVNVFEDWAERFPFTRIVAPEGTSGLIPTLITSR